MPDHCRGSCSRATSTTYHSRRLCALIPLGSSSAVRGSAVIPWKERWLQGRMVRFHDHCATPGMIIPVHQNWLMGQSLDTPVLIETDKLILNMFYSMPSHGSHCLIPCISFFFVQTFLLQEFVWFSCRMRFLFYSSHLVRNVHRAIVHNARYGT